MTASRTSRGALSRRRTVATTATRTALLGLLVLGVAQGASVHGTPATDTQASGSADLLAGASADPGLTDLRGGLDTSRDAERSGTLTVTADGATTSVPLAGATLAETLEAAGILVGADDLVSAELSGAASDGDAVTIQRVARTVVTEEGASGRDSTSSTTFEVVTVDGVEVSRTEIASTETLGVLDSAIASGDNVEVGRLIAAQNGWTGSQWECLYSLWQKESRWLVTADNPTSSAYGIPQALPGSKMSSAGADWATNPATQVTWGIGYIEDVYGSPCAAWGHSQAHNWY